MDDGICDTKRLIILGFSIDVVHSQCNGKLSSIEFLEHFETLEISSLQRFHQASFLPTSIRKKSDELCGAQFEQHGRQYDLFGEQETDNPRRVFTNKDFPQGLVFLA